VESLTADYSIEVRSGHWEVVVEEEAIAFGEWGRLAVGEG